MDRGGRPQAFQNGELIFHRNWPYVYAFANKTDGSSKVNGKFDVRRCLASPARCVQPWRWKPTQSPRMRRTRARRRTSEVHGVGRVQKSDTLATGNRRS